MPSLRFSLRLDSGIMEDLVGLARQADDAGLDRLWISEGEHSAFLGAAMAACHTRQVGLGTGIARAFIRTPWETAFTALDLHTYSNGRFVLGLGAYRQHEVEAWHGMGYSQPAARLREYVQMVKSLLRALPRRESVTWEGTFYRLRYDGRGTTGSPALGSADLPPPPVHLGTEGLTMARVAGEVADGLLSDMLGTPFYLREVLWPAIREGREAAGRPDLPFELTATLTCAIARDRKQARWDAARALAVYAAQPKKEPAFARHGFGELARQVQVTPPAKAPELIPDEMIDCFCAAGEPDEVRKAARRFAGLATGVRLMAPPFVLSPAEALSYQQAIVETFGR